MTYQQDPKDKLRAAVAMTEIEKAQRSFHTGASGVFIRVTLTVVFMYLFVISYMLLGIAGLVYVSVLSLVALLVPYFYQAVKDMFKRRRAQKPSRVLGRESLQES